MRTFADTGAFKTRFSTASPTSRRNAGYDGRRDGTRIQQTLSGGHRSSDDAVAQKQTANGFSTGMWSGAVTGMAFTCNPLHLRPAISYGLS